LQWVPLAFSSFELGSNLLPLFCSSFSFGPGPKYYVEMRLTFHPDSNIVQDATTEIDPVIILETADINDMPHTVHFFLEQVRHGIYDKTAFFRNAPNFVQAGPGHDHVKLLTLEQQEPSLAHVLFQEHSHDLNHKQYTLGLMGRPGGPDFYVNMQDNSEQHGLSNMANQRSDVMLEADPCFARIVKGFNTVERIHRADVKDEELSFRRKQSLMEHQVVIESMRILDDYSSSETTPTESIAMQR
jgi:cyclophilin family peptidyl-prolyl cis-trans isomerase